MKNSTLFVSIAVGVVVLGGLAFVMLSKKGTPVLESGKEVLVTPPAGSSLPPPKSDAQSGKKMAFSEFLKQGGGSYKCTIHQSVNGTDTVGTTYISEGNVRGEFANSVSGVNMTAYVLVRDGYSYSWTSMAPTMGFKVKNVEPKDGNTSQGTSGSYSFNSQQIGDYDCEPWTEDSAIFELPKGVTFSEITQQ